MTHALDPIPHKKLSLKTRRDLSRVPLMDSMFAFLPMDKLDQEKHTPSKETKKIQVLPQDHLLNYIRQQKWWRNIMKWVLIAIWLSFTLTNFMISSWPKTRSHLSKLHLNLRSRKTRVPTWFIFRMLWDRIFLLMRKPWRSTSMGWSQEEQEQLIWIRQALDLILFSQSLFRWRTNKLNR